MNPDEGGIDSPDVDYMVGRRAAAHAEALALREDVPLEDQPIARLPIDEVSARRQASWGL